ncbi:MAG: hypothetical protein JXA07_12390 [Spirochaetes bacterium]|nr:hypothetical protein [Spirochaetota bacterium]
MKFTKLTVMCLLLFSFLAAGCSESDDNNFYFGYISPGEFRPKGVAHEKSYSFAAIPAPGGSSCSPTVEYDPENPTASNNGCLAIHCIWYVGDLTSTYVPTEGIVVSHRTAPNKYTLRLVRAPGLEWQISLVLNGVLYKASSSAVTLTPDVSTEDTLPYYKYDPTPPPPDSGDEVEYDASNIKIKLLRVVFNENITLENETKTKSINITAGDSIVAQTHGL